MNKNKHQKIFFICEIIDTRFLMLYILLSFFFPRFLVFLLFLFLVCLARYFVFGSPFILLQQFFAWTIALKRAHTHKKINECRTERKNSKKKKRKKIQRAREKLSQKQTLWQTTLMLVMMWFYDYDTFIKWFIISVCRPGLHSPSETHSIQFYFLVSFSFFCSLRSHSSSHFTKQEKKKYETKRMKCADNQKRKKKGLTFRWT